MPTNCEIHKKKLTTLIAEGHETVDEKMILDLCEQEDEDLKTEIDTTCSTVDSLFKRMTIDLYEESKTLVSNNGDHDNMQCVPDLCHEIIHLSKLLPLWSAIMNSHFTNSGNISSSATVESNIHDIKNRVFKNVELPARIDNFLLRHVEILQGTIILVESAHVSGAAKTKVEGKFYFFISLFIFLRVDFVL